MPISCFFGSFRGLWNFFSVARTHYTGVSPQILHVSTSLFSQLLTRMIDGFVCVCVCVCVGVIRAGPRAGPTVTGSSQTEGSGTGDTGRGRGSEL